MHDRSLMARGHCLVELTKCKHSASTAIQMHNTKMRE